MYIYIYAQTECMCVYFDMYTYIHMSMFLFLLALNYGRTLGPDSASLTCLRGIWTKSMRVSTMVSQRRILGPIFRGGFKYFYPWGNDPIWLIQLVTFFRWVETTNMTNAGNLKSYIVGTARWWRSRVNIPNRNNIIECMSFQKKWESECLSAQA